MAEAERDGDVSPTSVETTLDSETWGYEVRRRVGRRCTVCAGTSVASTGRVACGSRAELFVALLDRL